MKLVGGHPNTFSLLLALALSLPILSQPLWASSTYPCATTGANGATSNVLCANILVSNTIIDVGQYSTVAVIGLNSISGTQLTANIMFSSANIPTSNTVTFSVNTLSQPTANTISFSINAFAPNDLVLSANVPGTPVQMLIQNPIFSNSITNTIIGPWTFNVFVSDGSNVIETSNILTVNINPPVGVKLTTNPQQPLVETGNTVTVNDIVQGGTGPFTYNWFVGNVIGGYDMLQFSLIPPFNMPSPPPPNTLPTPMFTYQNPTNSLASGNYVWNGVAFNAIAPGNALASPSGNEASLPVLIPNIFTVTSSIPNAFTLNLPAGSLPARSTQTSQVIYSLDTYSLIQANTFNAMTGRGPQPINGMTSGVNVILTNLGVSPNYISANTPPLGIMIQGYALNRSGSVVRTQVFAMFNSLPAPGSSESNDSRFPLLFNVTNVTIMGPPIPANGIKLKIYDSANIGTSTSDAANNLLLATFTYNGPMLLYNASGENFLGTAQLSTNTVQYNEENGIPANFILTSNDLVGTPPSTSVPYFTYNMLEISTIGGTSPDSFVNLNLQNSSVPGQFPSYSLGAMPQQQNQQPTIFATYTNPQGTTMGERQFNVTARGSVFGPPNPMGLIYFMATNAVIWEQGAQTQSNTIVPFAGSFARPTVLKVQTIDFGTSTPVASNNMAVIGSYPPIQIPQSAITLTNSTLSVGQTTFATMHLSGGQPPYIGIWNVLPPGVGSTQNTLLPMVLPVNEITLLVNVIAANEITFTPTLGINNTHGGGRNNTMLLSIYNYNAYLTLPTLAGSAPQQLLIATGLSSDNVYGLWNGDSTVSGSDPAVSFTVLGPTSSSPSSSGPTSYTVTLSDNIDSSSASTNIFNAFVVDASSGAIISSYSYNQSELPTSITFSNQYSLRFNFACSVSAGSQSYNYANDTVGAGVIPCNSNDTVYGGSYEVLYSKAVQTTSTTSTTSAITTVQKTSKPQPTATTSAQPTTMQTVQSTSEQSTLATTISNSNGSATAAPYSSGPSSATIGIVAIAIIAILAIAAYLALKGRKRRY